MSRPGGTRPQREEIGERSGTSVGELPVPCTNRPSSVLEKSDRLRRALRAPGIVRVVGAHDGVSARLCERHGFDAVWASGLGISASNGVPDASILTMTHFLAASVVIDRSTSLPVIADCDTGFGDVNVVMHMVREYERAGIAAVCIEDKQFPKRNSFRGGHRLADKHEFSAKIRAAKAAATPGGMAVIARLESLIAGVGLDDAFARAEAYADAGADAILVHSKSREPDEVTAFARRWCAAGRAEPLIVVPTTYYDVTADDLAATGFKAVIYANQTLRASIQAMDEALGAITLAGSSAAIEDAVASVEDVFALIGTDQIELVDAWFEGEIEHARASADVRPGPHPG